MAAGKQNRIMATRIPMSWSKSVNRERHERQQNEAEMKDRNHIARLRFLAKLQATKQED